MLSYSPSIVETACRRLHCWVTCTTMHSTYALLLGIVFLVALPPSSRADAPPPIAHLAPDEVKKAVELYNEIKGTVWLYKWEKGVLPVGFGEDGHIAMSPAWAKYQWRVIGPRQVLWQEKPGGEVKVLDFNDDLTSFQARGWDNAKKESGTPKGEKIPK
jgi:hypothetical protein